MALVVLSVVEQRLDAVRAVLSGESVVEVAARYEVARSTLHRWVGRYLEGSVAGLEDRSHRPLSCPHQVDALVEAAVAEVRRRHPRWGAKRIRLELLRRLPPTWPVGVEPPSDRTVNRILLRQGLAQATTAEKASVIVRSVRASGSDAVVGNRHRRGDLAGRHHDRCRAGGEGGDRGR